MLHKTRGIVLGYVRYRETSIVLRAYTEAFGIQGYVVNSVRSAKTKTGMGMFQPLSLLEMVVYHKTDSGLNRISEIRSARPWTDIPFSASKTATAMFLAELLGKLLKEESANEELFHFLFSSLEYLDLMRIQPENFHLHFMLGLASVMGVAPSSPLDILPLPTRNIADYHAAVAAFDTMMQNGFGAELQINTAIRRIMLDGMLNWYNLHYHIGELNSPAVFREINEG
ncbi:MAG: DNA repair protein RecO [Bacteroidota bacterium]